MQFHTVVQSFTQYKLWHLAVNTISPCFPVSCTVVFYVEVIVEHLVQLLPMINFEILNSVGKKQKLAWLSGTGSHVEIIIRACFFIEIPVFLKFNFGHFSIFQSFSPWPTTATTDDGDSSSHNHAHATILHTTIKQTILVTTS
jgi:hypothetical protein